MLSFFCLVCVYFNLISISVLIIEDNYNYNKDLILRLNLLSCGNFLLTIVILLMPFLMHLTLGYA